MQNMKNRFHYIDKKLVSNETGEGILSIRNFDIGDMLFTKVSETITWYDCHGSVGKYVCQINNLKSLNKQVLTTELNQILNSGSEIKLTTLLERNNEFLRIFPKRKLEITIYDPDKYPSDESGFYFKFKEWDIVYPKQIKKSNENLMAGKFLQYFEESVRNYNYVPGDIVSFSSSGFYDGRSCYFIATQQESDLDNERVKYYEKLIKEGKRPYCVVFNNSTNDSNNHYLIDGHHKLKAYQNLKSNPRVLEVTQCFDKEDIRLWEQTCEILNESLYKWHLNHIFSKCYYQPKYIEIIKESKANPFNKFIKQGYIEELWINGNFKTKGNYRDNVPEGIVETFHENGNPKTIALYKDGRVFRYIKSWFHSGELSSEYIKQPDYKNGVQINYHKTGEVSSRTYFKNGVNADGKSSVSYYQDGTVQYEATHKDGIVINRKYYDRRGNLTQENDR